MVSQAMRHNLEAHIRGERARDVDAAMAPLSENPSYAIPGGVLVGRAAIRAMYQNVLPQLPPEMFDEYLRALDDPVVTSWGDDHCVIEYDARYPHHCGMVVVVHFEGNLVRSENTYFTSLERFSRALQGHKNDVVAAS